MTYSRHLDDERAIGLRSKLKSIARRLTSRIGLVDRRSLVFELPPVDLRGLGLRPDEALARAGAARFVIDAPLAWCRGLNAEAFPLVPGAGHPYVETARQLLAEGDTAYRDTPLRRYYESYQPRSAADRLGAPLAGPTVSAPAEVASMPWHTPRSEGDAIRRRAVLRAENRAHGAALDHSHGFMDFGPVSEAKGALAVTRLKRLLGRISEEGFQLMPGRSGLCRAQILISGDAYRAVLSIGQHRAAALAALGGETIPFWPLPNPVRREEVMLWPGVRAGAYSRDAALAVFDRVFAGRQPPGLEASRFVHGAPAAPVRRTHSG